MVDIMLQEDQFVQERLHSPPLLLFQNKEAINQQFLQGHPQGVENLLLKLAIDRLDCGVIGIYSKERNEVVFHIGNKDIYNTLDPSLIQKKLGDDNKPIFIENNNHLIYIYPIVNGYIYTYQDNIQNMPNQALFVEMIILAIILAVFGAKLAENKTQKRIKNFKQELHALKESGEPLPLYNDNFNEIVNSVNELKEHLSSIQKLLYSILDSLPLGIVYYDEEGKVMYVNKTVTTITGYCENEIKNFMISGNILNSNESVFWETLRSGESFLGFESYCPTKDGKEIPVMTSTKPLIDHSDKFIGTISSFFDISEQQRLRKIEYRAKVMLDHISDGVMMVDNGGVIIGFNRGAEVMTGFKSDQVLGKKYDDIFIKRKTIFTKLTQTLESKREYSNYKKETKMEDGRKVYLIITTKLLWDEEGKQLGAMGIYKDITHLEELSQQIQRADKLSVVGELAAGTAHEIRNPLTTIKGFIQLLITEFKDTNKEQYIHLILDEINHINEIIREMLLLAKPVYPRKTLVSLNQIIKDIVVFMNPEAVLYNVELHYQLDVELPKVDLDDRQIKQVFINLVRNAIQAVKKDGHITITSGYNKNTEMIEITFEDNGEGIPENKIAKIYEPFYTTKDDGTGLGIPVSYRIMKNHGGDLQIFSEFNKGTTVKLYFPIVKDDSSEDR